MRTSGPICEPRCRTTAQVVMVDADPARADGRLGASRPSDAALFGSGLDPSDSVILAALQAFEDGRLERRQR